MGLGLLLVVAMATGCSFKGGPTVRTDREGGWMPTPVSIRVFPGTRFVVDDGEILLDARIELLDAQGDPMKASGRYRFDLHEPQNDGELGLRLYVWRSDVLSLAQHAEHWDRVTNAYAFRLRLREPATAQDSSRLLVSFEPSGEGERLEDRVDLEPAEGA